jgi:hypothetical protein
MAKETKDHNEPTSIYCTLGPYAGQRLTVSPAEAKQAIADGWAVDPDAPVADEPPKEPTPEERNKALEAAEKAANKLRGEPEDETRDMTPGDEGGKYKTRNVKRGE